MSSEQLIRSRVLALKRGDKGREQGVLKLMVLLVGRMLDRVHLVEHIVNLRGIEVLENLGKQLGAWTARSAQAT